MPPRPKHLDLQLKSRALPHGVDVPESLLQEVCAEVGLDPYRDAHEVLDALRYPPDRECCDSGCDPCVLTVLRAAQLVRQRMASESRGTE